MLKYYENYIKGEYIYSRLDDSICKQKDDCYEFRKEIVNYVYNYEQESSCKELLKFLPLVLFLYNNNKDVAFTDDKIDIYLNPNYFRSKISSIEEWEFIFCHECYHQIWDTFEVQKRIGKELGGCYSKVLNIASDCIINEMLRASNRKIPPMVVTAETIKRDFDVDYEDYDTQYSLYMKIINSDKFKQKQEEQKQKQQQGGGNQQQQQGDNQQQQQGGDNQQQQQGGGNQQQQGSKENSEDQTELDDNNSGNGDNDNKEDDDDVDENYTEDSDFEDNEDDDDVDENYSEDADLEDDDDDEEQDEPLTDDGSLFDYDDYSDSENDKDGKEDGKESNQKGSQKDSQEGNQKGSQENESGKGNESESESKSNQNGNKSGEDEGDKDGYSRGGTDKLSERKIISREELEKIHEQAIDICKNKLGGLTSKFIEKCNSSSRLENPNLNQAKIKQSFGGSGSKWDDELFDIVTNYMDEMLYDPYPDTRRSYYKPNRHMYDVKRRSGGKILIPGERVEDKTLHVKFAFFLDGSGSMTGQRIQGASLAANAIANVIDKKYGEDLNDYKEDEDEIAFEMYAFYNDVVYDDETYRKYNVRKMPPIAKIERNTIPYTGGGTMSYKNLFNNFKKYGTDCLINLIFTDADQPIENGDEEYLKNFIEENDGLIVYLACEDKNQELLQRLADENEGKFYYILSDDNFLVENEELINAKNQTNESRFNIKKLDFIPLFEEYFYKE